MGSMADNASTPSRPTSNLELESQDKEIVSTEIRQQILSILGTIYVPLLIAGMITNLINIRVFIEQGIRNSSTNIGLLLLSVFDLLNCLASLPYALCFCVGLLEGVATQTTCVTYTRLAVFQHYALYHCSTWTTVFLSMERAVCVILPLKVRLIFRPKFAAIFIAFVFVFFVGLQCFYYALFKIVWIVHPGLNQTVAILQPTNVVSIGQRYQVTHITITQNILPNLAVAITFINTVIMTRKLVEVKKWRQGNTGDGTGTGQNEKSGQKNNNMSSKDVELIKSVTIVTSLFLVCVFLEWIPGISVLIWPGMSVAGINTNFYQVLYSFKALFSFFNFSSNFFFYVRISSRYKEAFVKLFPTCSIYVQT